MKQMKSLFTSLALLLAGAASYGQYTVDWVANTYGDNTHHVGNCARSMWVDTNGMIYTASLWDENAGGIGIYQNGQTLGSMGAHGEVQGCSIAGNANYIFAEEQGSNGGQVARYNRATRVREIMFSVSSTNGDSVPGLAISPLNGLLYASDKPGNRIRVFTTNGVWQQDWTVANPGTLAIDHTGNVWVAQMTNAAIQEFSASGSPLNTITMSSSSRPSSLYVDPQNQLWVGDQGPDENIKIYTNLTTTPTLSGTYGVTGGYLSTSNGAVKGQTGAKRFTRVVGIGSDSSGNLYVLNNPWGGTWDLGRNGGTDLHCYNTSGSLAWTLQSLNFEGVAVADPQTDATNLYSGEFVFTGSGGGGFLANTVDPFDYPNDERLDVANAHSRGEDFGMTAVVNSHRILIASGQDPDSFNSYYFNAANGYIAIPGIEWGTNHERNGFCLDSAGNVWEGRDKTSAIWFNQLTGFDANGAPIYAAATSTPTPASIVPMNRILYLPSSDTMILAGGNPTDWTALGPVVQVYNGWMAGNTNNPDTTITLNTNLNPKTMAAVGGYLFVGYVHTIPNIDVFNLATGALVLTMTNSATVYVGNDVDSMCGLSAYQKANGQYVITKDNYNGGSVVIYRWTPSQSPPPAPAGLTATAASATQIDLSWNASSGASSYNVKRSSTGGGPYTTIAAGVTATDYDDAGLMPVTTYYYVVSATNSSGESANSSQASATTLSGLPNPWQTQDIGAVGIAGNASYSNGTFTVTGSGTDINGTADQFRYVYQTCAATNSITARVANMTTNSNSGAKAGVMFHDTLATNSIEVSITLTPANGVTWQYRTATGGSTTGSRATGLATPYWVRLVRSGGTFAGYASPDGSTWTQEFSTDITMSSTAYAGLAVTSRNNTTTCTGTFDNVNFQ